MARALRSTAPAPRVSRALVAAGLVRAVVAAVSLALLLVVAAGPLVGTAAAAAIEPSDQGSEVVRTTPSAPGATLTVDGDVAELAVAPGRAVTVLGYQGEPFLRVSPDGTVERNERSSVVLADPNSPVTTVVAPRMGSADEAQWVVVGDGGTARWHDHRVHWMAGSPPPSSDGLVMAWRVPLVVDGTTVAVDGEVRRRSVVDPLPWLAVVVVTTAVAVLVTRRRPLVGVAALAAVGGALAVVVELTPLVTARPGGVDLLRLAVAVAAVGLGTGGLVVSRRRGLLGSLGVAALAGWAVPAVPALYQPVVTGPLPVAVARIVVAVEVGIVLAGLVAAVAVAGAGQLVDAADGPSSRPSRRRSSLARSGTSSHGARRQRSSSPRSPASSDAAPADGSASTDASSAVGSAPVADPRTPLV